MSSISISVCSWHPSAVVCRLLLLLPFHDSLDADQCIAHLAFSHSLVDPQPFEHSKCDLRAKTVHTMQPYTHTHMHTEYDDTTYMPVSTLTFFHCCPACWPLLGFSDRPFFVAMPPCQRCGLGKRSGNGRGWCSNQACREAEKKEEEQQQAAKR